MIKILFAIDGLRAGGKERRFLELVKQLRFSNDIVYEIVILNKEVHYKEVFELSVKLHFLIRKKAQDLSIFRQFFSIVREFNPNIIHSWDTISTIYSIPTAKLLRIKLITSKISDAPVNFRIFTAYGISSKLCFHFSDLILSNSEAGIEAYRVSKKKSHVIRNGFDFERISKLKPKVDVKETLKINEPFIVIMVASFSKNKDFKTFLEAGIIVRSSYKDIAFICVGDGPLRTQLQESFLQSGIYFTGRQTDVESIMNIGDVGALITNNNEHGEGISNSLLEFMALGIPVIASNNGGNLELIEDNHSGSILSENNPQKLAELIIQHYDNREQYTLMGLNAQERIKNDFSIENMVIKFKNVYQSLYKRI